ncbi:MAG: helix-turn-helix transcriptional regulator [Aestuariivirga sp.]
MVSKLKQLWQDFGDMGFRHSYLSSWLGDFLAGQIYFMRTKRDMSQYDFLEPVGVSQSVISKLEKSCENATLSTLKKLALAFDVALIVKFVPFSEFAEESLRSSLGNKIVSFPKDHISELASPPGNLISNDMGESLEIMVPQTSLPKINLSVMGVAGNA